ncbi:hypothetical protein ACJA25_03630 [Mycoplasmopsis hyopharyngis]|uniref:hypothetical protein n=1 Tax=Mycoplasmopsis hyopharyngis TaxID=29558 RepID=UPI003872D3FC
MKKRILYSFLSLCPLVIFPLISASCSKTRTKEELRKEIISNLNSYSLFDEQLIFHQDNSSKNVNIKVIDDDFLKQEISPEKTIESEIIYFERTNSWPIEFNDNKNINSYDKNVEGEPKRIIGLDEKQQTIQDSKYSWFKYYLSSYKDPFLFNFKPDLLQGNINEFQPKFQDFAKLLPDKDYEGKDFDFDNFSSFNHYNLFKNVKQFSQNHFLDENKKYLFFTGTNLVGGFEKQDEYGVPIYEDSKDNIFYWMPYIKNNKLHFSRIIKNKKVDFLHSKTSTRTISLNTMLFNIEKLKGMLNLSEKEEFDFSKHIVIENDTYYQNFSNEYKKNMIWTKEQLLKKYSSNKKEKQCVEEIISNAQIPPRIPNSTK